MKWKQVAFVLALSGCGASQASIPETPAPVPSPDAFQADLDMMCSSPSASAVQNADASERMRLLAAHIEENLQSPEGHELFDALATASDKAGLLGSVRRDAGHTGDCELQNVLASSSESAGEEVRVDEVPASDEGDAGDASQVTGLLSRDQVQTVIRENHNQVRYCYERRLHEEPTLQGRTVAHFIINPAGHVQSVSVERSFDAGVESCLERAIARWTFPAPEGGGVVAVTYPFEFRPRETGTR